MTSHHPSHRIPRHRHPLCLLAAFVCAGAPLAATTVSPASLPAELSRRTTVDPAGREVVTIRVHPVLRAVAEPPLTTPASIPTATSATLLEDLRLAAKKHASLTVSAIVYPGHPVLSELRWHAAGREWLAYSNLDWHALTQLTHFETEDTAYQWFPFVSDGDAEHRPRPPGLVFSGPEAEYVVYASRAEWEAAPEAFAALDWLHVYYEQNRARLDTALALRRAEEARRAAEPPPPPRPHVVRYYVPAPTPTPVVEGGAR